MDNHWFLFASSTLAALWAEWLFVQYYNKYATSLSLWTIILCVLSVLYSLLVTFWAGNCAELQRKVLILGKTSRRLRSLEEFIGAGVRDKGIVSYLLVYEILVRAIKSSPGH